jgi:hypothetical protein
MPAAAALLEAVVQGRCAGTGAVVILQLVGNLLLLWLVCVRGAIVDHAACYRSACAPANTPAWVVLPAPLLRLCDIINVVTEFMVGCCREAWVAASTINCGC